MCPYGRMISTRVVAEVLEKNLLNCCVSTIGWWLFGWAFAHAG